MLLKDKNLWILLRNVYTSINIDVGVPQSFFFLGSYSFLKG